MRTVSRRERRKRKSSIFRSAMSSPKLIAGLISGNPILLAQAGKDLLKKQGVDVMEFPVSAKVEEALALKRQLQSELAADMSWSCIPANQSQTDCWWAPPRAEAFREPNSAPSGVFYKDNTFRIAHAKLKPNLFGMITYGDYPFDIVINKDITRGRRRLSLAHELLHGFDKISKLGIGENGVHQLAQYVMNTVKPVLDQYENEF